MQESVPSPSAVQAGFAATLFDEWCRYGLRDVVLCPGSRSTPLALACAMRSELSVHVRIDERSAGFFALGRALSTERPVAIVVTSGTAAAELLAVVVEADLACVPLLVLTADRPPELHRVGAPQTVNQRDLYGAKVRRFEEPGVARIEAVASWRALASRLWFEAVGVSGLAGPVHLNAAFVEPLLGEPIELPTGRENGRPWRMPPANSVVRAELAIDGQRVLAVVGSGVDALTIEHCAALNWVVLGDATAQGSIAYFDPLLRDREFADEVRPDLVVRLGGLPSSKVLQEQLRNWRVRTVAMDGCGRFADPDGLVSEVVHGLPHRDQISLAANAEYRARWLEASQRVGRWLEDSIDNDAELSEPGIARTMVMASSRLQVPLVVGSSMPVRDVEWWSPPRESPTFANRGANGIDGVVSTVLGVAAGSRGLGLVGDLTMLHDVSALVDGLGDAGGSCVLVVVDNQGGGIFSFLAQASALTSERFEQLFAAPRPHDLVAVARAFGTQSEIVKTSAQLRTAIDAGLAQPGLSIVVAHVAPRDQNVLFHEELNVAIRQAWRGTN